MGFDLQLRQLMTQTITVYPRTGHNNYGKPVYGSTGVSYPCRIAAKPRWVRDARGEVVEVTSTIWVGSTGTIDASDRIELPDGSTPEVLRVMRFPDQNGHHHSQIELGH